MGAISSSACAVSAAAVSVAAGEVTVSGEAVSDSDSGGATCSIIFRSDGTVDKIEGATTTQIDSGTDWIIPNGDASSDYDVRATSISSGTSDTFAAEGAAEDVWIDLGSDREWRFTESSPFGAHDISCTFEIRFDGGSVLDSASYTFDLVVSP